MFGKKREVSLEELQEKTALKARVDMLVELGAGLKNIDFSSSAKLEKAINKAKECYELAQQILEEQASEDIEAFQEECEECDCDDEDEDEDFEDDED